LGRGVEGGALLSCRLAAPRRGQGAPGCAVYHEVCAPARGRSPPFHREPGSVDCGRHYLL